MRTIEDLNKLLEQYPMYFRIKLFWKFWKYHDYKIKRFEMKKRQLLIIWEKKSELFMTWDEELCIDKLYNEILEKQSINNHCLFAYIA